MKINFTDVEKLPLSKEKSSCTLREKESDSSRQVWETKLSSPQKKLFFLKALLLSIQAIKNKDYSKFDAHTTSNCCHGIAVLSHDRIKKCLKLDLSPIYREAEELTRHLSVNQDFYCNSFLEKLPLELVDLLSLYVLAHSRKIDPVHGAYSCFGALKVISPAPNRFYKKIMNNLRKHFSNFVAFNYKKLGQQIHFEDILGLPVETWIKYVQEPFLRKDQKGGVYAPCIFSMQIAIAYLASKGIKVVVLNDILDKGADTKCRHVEILVAEANGLFRPLTEDEISMLEPAEEYEPVVVFGDFPI